MFTAQEQVGGRVRTEVINGFPFDHGAQFVHGEIGNPLYDYAARNALLSNLPSFEGEGRENVNLMPLKMNEQNKIHNFCSQGTSTHNVVFVWTRKL